MRAANVETSDRLQRVLALLQRGGEHSTFDIIMQSHVCAVNSIIAELRQNGYDISCQRRGARWYYRLK